MLVYIDSSDNRKTIIKLDGDQLVKEYKYPRDQKILEVMAELLKKKKIDPKQISAMKVNTGPGSYTSLRVSCAIANVMAWTLGIKVNRKDQVEPIY